MNILVLGSTGMLGRYMVNYLSEHHDVVGMSRPQFDATRDISFRLRRAIRKSDIVINCVGVLKPYINEIGIAKVIKINSVFPQLIADCCEKYNTRMIHISSDCIFSGKIGSYNEDSICDADDIYARTKCIEPPTALTIRTSFVGEDSNADGVGLLQWVLNQPETLTGYTNCMWNGVTCLQLCKVVNNIIYEPLTNNKQHVFSPTSISKYELLHEICKVYDINTEIIPVEVSEITGTKIDGKLDRTLSTIYNKITTPDINQQLTEQKIFYHERSM